LLVAIVGTAVTYKLSPKICLMMAILTTGQFLYSWRKTRWKQYSFAEYALSGTLNPFLRLLCGATVGRAFSTEGQIIIANIVLLHVCLVWHKRDSAHLPHTPDVIDKTWKSTAPILGLVIAALLIFLSNSTIQEYLP